MDWTPIVVAIISGVVSSFSAILVFITNEKSRKQKMEESHKEQLKATEESIKKTLDEHRAEYLDGIEKINKRIDGLEDSFTDLQALYQSTSAVVSLKIDQLEKKQDKHNSIIERTYKLETDVEVLKQRETASEKRLRELEDDRK